MTFQMLSTVLFILFSSLYGKTHAFCAFSSEGLPADLTQAVVRSSDWMKQFYREKAISVYRAGSMFGTLRIAGHTPNTLLTEFKNEQGLSFEQTLKNELDSVQNISSIPTPQLALMIQGVISICRYPEDFHGYNLIQTLLDGFPGFMMQPEFSNYFGYSLAVIALCNARQDVPDSVIEELLKGANRDDDPHSVDTRALILTALSCVSTPNNTLQCKVDRAIRKLARSLIKDQDKTTGAFGNQFSTALAVGALQAARVHTNSYRCDKAMRYILTFQNYEGSFGNILANIQVTPALLGESYALISLTCPPAPTPTPPPKIITVRVELEFNVPNLTRTEPAVTVNVTNGTTAFTVLELASQQNPCYNATYQQFSFGRSILSICGVARDTSKSYFWLIYINGVSAQVGIDGLKPNDGDIITFVYKELSFK